MKDIKKSKRFFRFLYLKLFRINDSPERVAFGLGLGVFFGIMPGMGPLAALFTAVILKANRAAALFGSLLTNTWLSVPTFMIAVKAGSAATGTSFDYLHDQWHIFLKDFRWGALLKVSVYKVFFPVLVGYMVVGLTVGAAAYLAAIILLKSRRHRRPKNV